MKATDRLTASLVALAADGGRPPCGDFDVHLLWTSEDGDERGLAASLCSGCPVLVVCGQAGEEGGEAFVWGGVDRGAKTRANRGRAA